MLRPDLSTGRTTLCLRIFARPRSLSGAFNFTPSLLPLTNEHAKVPGLGEVNLKRVVRKLYMRFFVLQASTKIVERRRMN